MKSGFSTNFLSSLGFLKACAIILSLNQAGTLNLLTKFLINSTEI
jgi:hypothetical protein